MFYSHEILTSRKHGVATVWLVATLGSKSSLKKVTRKAILDVNVPKACEIIIDPSAPMALRLQGNLLYGVSRVYSQQCGYVLADLQHFREKMRGVTAVIKEMEIDREAGRARADQLNLPDDPLFLPDLDMNFDLSAFDISTDPLLYPGTLSPAGPASRHSSQQLKVEGLDLGGLDELGLVFPLADTPGAGGIGEFSIGGGTSSALKTASNAGYMAMFDDSALNEHPEFDIDAEGNILELPSVSQGARQSVALSTTSVGGRLESESGINARVRAEHEGGVQFDDLNPEFNLDDGIISNWEDDPKLPLALPFPPARREEASASEKARPSSSAHPETEPVSTANAPQRRIKAPKPLLVDQHTELTNRELAEWNTNYLANMADATRHKDQHKALAQAKKNAAFWVLEQGIGGIATSFGGERVPHPLSVFSGRALLEALTGRESSPAAGRKRSRDSATEEEDEEEGRHVRARGEDEEQIGRGDHYGIIAFGGDDGVMVPQDDMPPSEVGRNAPASLPDHSSQMPWNLSISRHGSARPGSGFPGGINSSAGGLVGGFELGPPLSLARHGSRLTSASPLQGKGLLPRLSKISSGLEIISQSNLPSGADNLDDEGLAIASDMMAGDMMGDEEFQLYGPAAAVDTQTAAQSRWISATLENEAQNFLLFVENAVQERAGEHDRWGQATITLQELLPPTENSNVVAAQALLHVLSLATKGLIEVRQGKAFGDIEIGVVGGLAEEEVEEEEDLEL